MAINAKLWPIRRILMVKTIVSVIVKFVNRSYVSNKLTITGEDIVRRQNLMPYNALYYGNKLHWDQNEKSFTRSVMAAAQFDHHVTSSLSKVRCKARCKARGFACE